MDKNAPYGYTKKGTPRKRAARQNEGRPEREFDDKDREEIMAMSGYGMPFAEIAAVKKCKVDTLRKHCQEELDRGSSIAVAQMAESLFKTGKKGNVTAQIFFLCNRAPEQWQNVNKVRHEGEMNVHVDHTVVLNEFLGELARKSAGIRENGEIKQTNGATAPAAFR